MIIFKEFTYKNPWDIPPQSRFCNQCNGPFRSDIFYRVDMHDRCEETDKLEDDIHIFCNVYNFCSPECKEVFILSVM